MPEARFQVIAAGPHVSVQDAGRPGLMRFGVPGSGPMDRLSFAMANAALGNPEGAPGIEISVGGLELECLAGPVTVAVAGGGFIVTLDAVRSVSWVVLTVQQGQRLRIAPGHWGSWTYLCFAGALQARDWLGSVATHALSGSGGGMLVPGQVLTVAGAQRREDRVIACPVIARPRALLHVVPGPQDRFFDAAAMAALLGEPFSLSDAYDRMGVRLRGPLLTPVARLDMPSEPVARGSVQVAGDGVATVLLADHQTTGGYPKIATVLAGDLDGFAQLRPREIVRFHAVTAVQAVALARQRAVVRARVLAGLAR